jgi:hypothetical protein
LAAKKRTARPNVTRSKQAVAAPGPLHRSGHPSWRFEDADDYGPFAWTDLSLEETKELLEGLVHFEGHTVQETKRRGSKGTHHPCDLGSLSPEAMTRLRKLRHDDHDLLWGFRVMGNQKERVWALRYGDIFHFLWWDPDHKVAPSAKWGQ